MAFRPLAVRAGPSGEGSAGASPGRAVRLSLARAVITSLAARASPLRSCARASAAAGRGGPDPPGRGGRYAGKACQAARENFGILKIRDPSSILARLTKSVITKIGCSFMPQNNAVSLQGTSYEIGNVRRI